jgi:phosphonate transport system substrate-binding protein
MKRRLAILSCAAAILAGCAAAAPKMPARLVFGIQSTKPAQTQFAWAPLAADLGRRLGVPFDAVAASQGDTVRALAERRVDVVWLSSSAAIDAMIDADARTIALYQNVNGTRGYKAVLLARADSGIRTLDEALAPGRWRYAAGARTSTSGYVLPQHFLFTPRATTAEQTFRSVIYGGHPANMEALWTKQVDLAINNTTDSAQFEARTPGAKGAFVTLWESPLVPNDVLMVRADMPVALREQLLREVLAYGRTPQEKALLRDASGIERFVPADDTLLEPVAGFKFSTERAQVEQDAAASPEQKAQRLVALERRQSRFRRILAQPK